MVCNNGNLIFCRCYAVEFRVKNYKRFPWFARLNFSDCLVALVGVILVFFNVLEF